MCSWYHIHASGLIGSPTEPSRRRRRQVVLRRPVGAPAHEGADGGRRGVEDRDAVALDDLPEAILLRPVGRAFVHHDGRAVGERAVDDVAVAGDPADVGGAPVDVLVLEVEDPLASWRRRRPGSRRWCARCPWASRSCRRCRGCRACPRRPSARARTRARRPASARATSGRARPSCGRADRRRRAARRRRARSRACAASASSAICLSGTTLPRR